jgi:hypothetical protein
MAALLVALVLARLRDRPGPAQRLSFAPYRPAWNMTFLAVLTLTAQSFVLLNVPIEITRVLLALQSDHFSQTEASQLVQGYYEQLNEGSVQAGLFSGHGVVSDKPDPRLHFMDFTRVRRDVMGVELIPNFKGEYAGSLITINRWGMRDRDLERAKPPGVCRIALVGSSVVMGFGVGDEETFARRLEQNLNNHSELAESQQQYQVLNFGVGKYSALQRAAQLEKVVLDFEPDVVLYFTHQDELTTPAADMPKLLAYGKIEDPCLLEIAARAGVDDQMPRGVVRNRMFEHAQEIVECCYDRIVRNCREHAIVPVWVNLPMPGEFQIPIPPEFAMQLAEDAGFEIIDLADWHDGYDPNEVKLSTTDTHANVLGHRLIADRLTEALLARPQILQPSNSNQ